MNKKFQLIVLGCQMNSADAERISAILNGLGWKKTESEDEAGLIIVVACSVKQTSMNRVFGKGFEWRKQRRAGKLKTILTGCVLEQDRKKLSKLFDTILPIGEISRLPEIIAGKKSEVSAEEFDNAGYLSLDAERNNGFSALVPISNGCNNYCSYCAVPYARGAEVSRDAGEIIEECCNLIKQGYKEIILLGQNVNSYKCVSPLANLPAGRQEGKTRGGLINFPKLLKTIDNIEGDYWIRFMSSHPKDLSDELIEVMASCKHLAPHLHLAIQSGSDEILKKMNRRYTAGHYIKLAEKVRNKIPGLALSTDIIIGFPGETKPQFKQTEKLMKDLKFDMAYISPYSPREGTVAANLKDSVSPDEKKSRAYALNQILSQTALKNNQQYLGQTVRVLVDGYKNDKCFGKTGSHKVVSFSGDKSMIGRFVAIRITGVKPFSLSGEMA